MLKNMHLMTKVMTSFWISLVLSIMLTMHSQIGAVDIGVCYGMNGDNLPSPADVVQLYKRYSIRKMRLFDPNPSVLEALRGSQIPVSLGVRNEDMQTIASSQEVADLWINKNVVPYLPDITFSYITVGNEAIPGELGRYIAPAMQNLQNTLNSANLVNIKVTTVVSAGTLGNSYPPSAAVFSNDAAEGLGNILRFLSAQRSPLLINVYPYFAYASDPANIRLDYAQFTANGPVVQDGDLSYSNMFDAIVDAFYWAMEKEGMGDVGVVVSESGWPSGGSDFATPDLAQTYNTNFIQHVINSGTPKRPQAKIEAYIFAMFEENLKSQGVEQCFGLFSPNMEPVYSVFN